jgi:hypothetical protein
MAFLLVRAARPFLESSKWNRHSIHLFVWNASCIIIAFSRSRAIAGAASGDRPIKKAARALEGDGELLATTRRYSVGRAGVANNPTGATPGDRRIGPLGGAFARLRGSRVSTGSPLHDLAGRTFRSGQVFV